MNEWMNACVHFLENFCSSLREVASSIGFLGLTDNEKVTMYSCTVWNCEKRGEEGEHFVKGEQFPVAFTFSAQIHAIGEAQT